MPWLWASTIKRSKIEKSKSPFKSVSKTIKGPVTVKNASKDALTTGISAPNGKGMTVMSEICRADSQMANGNAAT